MTKFTLIPILFCLVATSVKAQLNPEPVAEIVNAALKKANKENKKVLLLFRAKWNPWSGVLDSAMRQPGTNMILHKYYVIAKITVEEKGDNTKLENPGAAALFSRYYSVMDSTSTIKKRVPCFIAINAQYNKIAQFNGYPEGKEDFNAFELFLKETSAIKPDEIAVLRKDFMDIFFKVTPPSASDVLNKAFASARAENKKVFLIFHASWCHWCHVLDTAMSDLACKNVFTDRYVICHLIVSESYKNLLNENPGAAKLIADYQTGLSKWERGIPLSVVLDKDGNKLGVFNGFPVPFYAGYKDFENLLKNTTTIKETDLKTIAEVFERVAQKNGLKPKK